jgi:transcriptional regulator GlxA family with amidase domain
MALALISRRQGTFFAQLVSDWFLHTEIRPSGGPQRSNLINRVGTTNNKALIAIELMETHIADPLSLENLGNLTGVSRRQLNRVFQKAFNKGTMEYYREIRLEKAKNLLRNSRMSVAEISEVTGFCTASHFSSSFLNLFAVPPSDYRKGSQFAFVGDS